MSFTIHCIIDYVPRTAYPPVSPTWAAGRSKIQAKLLRKLHPVLFGNLKVHLCTCSGCYAESHENHDKSHCTV